MDSLESLPPLLTTRAFAEQVSMTRKAIDRRVAKGTLRHVRIGRCVRIPRAELARLLGEADSSAAASSPTASSPTASSPNT